MSCKALRQAFPLIFAVVASIPTTLMAQQVASHVRVVRLSYVSGTVAVKRPGSTEWAKAMVNTPIQEGFEISTSEHGYAEVDCALVVTGRCPRCVSLRDASSRPPVHAP